MGGYRTVVVGTDGSDSSLPAVARAGAPAGAAGATLVVVCAYLPEARKAGAKDVKALAVAGSPVAVLHSVKGRLLGSVPADATRRSDVDVLVVHTTG